jgi:parvulin-like peptidyl-prolyl isomerase
LSRRPRFLTGIFNPSDIDPERRGMLMLIGGIGILVVFALVLIAYGYYSQNIQPRGETVFSVGDRDYDYAYLEKRVDADIASGEFQINDIQNSVASTVLKIQNEELVRLTARDKGISITNEELEARMRQELNVPADAPRERFASALQLELQNSGLSLKQYEEIVTSLALEDKLREQLATTVPAEGEQVDLLILQTATRESAQAALDRINAGEEFQDVAQEVSVHTSKQVGGEFGWAPRGLLPKSVEDVVFALTGRSQVVQNDLGFFVFEVRDKQTRPIDEALKERVVQSQLNETVTATRTAAGVTNSLTIGQVQDIAQHIQDSIG